MKQLLITIAALVLVGCSKPPPPDISIHKAARGRNIEAVKQHLAAGTDVNAKNKGGDTPLHIAAISGQDEIAELLIANGADVNAMNKHDETPLDHAGIFAETADLLLKHGGKWGVELKTEKSIHLAAKYGNIEAVKQHLAAGTDVNVKNEEGDETTPLHNAAWKGHKEIVELLIANGADVNAKDKTGVTPLWNAIFGGHMELVELLIASDADVNAKLQNGKTSLDLANNVINGDIYLHPPNSPAFDTYPKIADLLRKHGGKSGAEFSIHVAAELGNIESVKQHLAAGTDVNAKDDNGWTPLHHWALFGHKEIAELLISEGADVNAKRLDGKTPLDLTYGKKKIADLLRKHGGKTGEELKAEGK